MISIEALFKPCKRCDLLFTDLYSKILFDNSLIDCYHKTKIYNDLSSIFFDIDYEKNIQYHPIRVAKFNLISKYGHCNHTLLFFVESIFDELCKISRVITCTPNELFTKDTELSTRHTTHYLLRSSSIPISFYLNLYSIIRKVVKDIDISNNRVIVHYNNQIKDITFFNNSEYLNEFTAKMCFMIIPIFEEFELDLETLDAYVILYMQKDIINENKFYFIID